MAIRKILTRAIDSTASSANLNIDSNTLFLDATNNNVGIGTTSPINKLHVYKSNQNQLQLQCDDTGQVDINMGGTTTPNKGSIYFSDNANAMWFNTASTERMRIDSIGNLGLGVIPSAWNTNMRGLQLQGGATFASRTDAQVTYVGSNVYLGASTQEKYIANGYATIYSQSSGAHYWYKAASGTAGNNISFGSAAMALDANGRLGINTSTPTRALDIRYGARTVQLAPNPTTNYYGSGLYLSGDIGSAEKAWMVGTHYTGGATALVFEYSTNDTTYGSDVAPLNYSEKVRFDAYGNVGIGKTNPSEPLDVYGSIRFGTGNSGLFSTLYTYTSGAYNLCSYTSGAAGSQFLVMINGHGGVAATQTAIYNVSVHYNGALNSATLITGNTFTFDVSGGYLRITSGTYNWQYTVTVIRNDA